MANRTNIYLEDKHEKVVENKGLNLSKFVRKQIEKEYPEEFD